MKDKIYRIIDANFNRAKEGLRVCEDIVRFVLDDKKLTMNFKNIRHRISSILKTLNINEQNLIKSRSSSNDVGMASNIDEMNKKNINQILYANLQRVKESIRVLEEFSKLLNKKSSIKFKTLRFKIYELEKAVSKKISIIPDNQ